MDLLFENGNELFILFLSPILGLLIDKYLKRKLVLWAFGIISILLIPIFTPYYYVIPFTYQILGLLWFSIVYSFYSKQLIKKNTKILSATIISILLFVILGFGAFMDSFGGYTKVNQSWKGHGYKIEKKINYGFAGKPDTTYTLKEYTLIPLLEKNIETTVEIDSTNRCIIHFVTEKISLNKCTGRIKIYEITRKDKWNTK